MRNYRYACIAGVAALAVGAGIGLASAQQTSPGQSAQGNKAPANQQMNTGASAGNTGQSDEGASRGRTSQGNQGAKDRKMGQTNQGADQNKTGQSAEQQGGKSGRTAEEGNRANKAKTGAEQSGQEHRKGAAGERRNTNTGEAAQQNSSGNQPNAAQQGGNASQAQEGRNGNRNTSAQGERNGVHGLQSNATGMNVQLSNEQRTRIHDTVINAHGAPRVGRVDFDVTVGTAIPRNRIHAVPVPNTLVQIEPRWRGFLYFVYEDEVVIVNPHDMKIVAVVPA